MYTGEFLCRIRLKAIWDRAFYCLDRLELAILYLVGASDFRKREEG